MAGEPRAVSIIVPARNEERNLPHLLGSLVQSGEVVVVDDASIDGTARVAASFGASVLEARPLPLGWTGKNWACHQGAEAASGSSLLFLDADTWFEPGGFARFAQLAAPNQAISVLPYHVTVRAYEELSLFFNLLMAFGAGGFGAAGKERLFGQSLLIAREDYDRCGGHAAVRSAILENLTLAARVEAVGVRCRTFVGRSVLHVRMFPGGFGQLCEGWTKGFADGAAASGGKVLGLSIVWLTALMTSWLMMLTGEKDVRLAALVLTAIFVAQIYGMARQIGSFRFVTCLLYPVPLLFYFLLFGRSAYLRARKRPVRWRGRSL